MQQRPTWLLIAVAFFAGLYLGFAHGQRGILRAELAWKERAEIYSVQWGKIPLADTTPGKIARRCENEIANLKQW